MAGIIKRLNIKYFMLVYLGLLFIFSAYYSESLKIFGSGLAIILFYSVFDLLWTYWRERVWYLPVSSWISALVLSIVALPGPAWGIVLALPLVAVVTKHLLHFGKNRHVFNPAASALALVAIFTPAVSWWGTTPNYIWFFIVLAGVIILWKQNRWHVTAVFLFFYLFFLIIYWLSNGVVVSRLSQLIFSEGLSGAVLFFATVMLVEPITSTFKNKKQEMFYGALAGAAAVVLIYLARMYNLAYTDSLIGGLLISDFVCGLWFLPKKIKIIKKTEESVWFRDVPAKIRYPALTGEKKFDIVIIGAGMAGVSAAYFLSKSGKKVAVLEANTIGSGDSGYTTACATHFLDTTDATLMAWESSEAAIKLLKQIISEEKIACDWQEVNAVCFTKQADQSALAIFAEQARRLQIKDQTIKLLNKQEVSAALGASAEAGFRKPDLEGIFQPRKFLVALAERAEKFGATFFENSEVVDIKLGEGVIAKTKNGSVAAPQLVIANGLPLAKFFPVISKNLRQSISYVIDVKFSGKAPFSAGIYWDDLKPYHYFRPIGKNEFLLGGEDWILTEPKINNKPEEMLEKWLKNLVGQSTKFKVINHWQGSLFSTSDTLPIIGSAAEYGKNVLFMTGWAGNGMAQGFFGGKIVADLATGKANDFSRLFIPDRTLANLNNNKQNMEKFDNLPEDQGVIMEENGKEIAVIKTHGEVKKFLAACPHLGCKYGWNDKAKTWDCPCHGSRFKPDGTLLHGPATMGLDPAK